MNYDRSPIELKFRERISQENIKYEEQVPLRNIDKKLFPKFHLDFVLLCGDIRLAVELDGERFHRDSKASDAERDLMVLSNGYADILRFSGTDIKHGMDAVIDKVKETLDFHTKLETRASRRSSRTLSEDEISAEEGFEVIKTVKGCLSEKWLKSDLKHPANNENFLNDIEKELKKVGYLVGPDITKYFHETIKKKTGFNYMELPFMAYGKRFIILLDKTRTCCEFPGYLTETWFESKKHFKIVIALKLKPESVHERVKTAGKYYAVFAPRSKSFKSDSLKADAVHEIKEKAKQAHEVHYEKEKDWKKRTDNYVYIFCSKKSGYSGWKLKNDKYAKIHNFSGDPTVKDIQNAVIKSLEATKRFGSISIFSDITWLINALEEKTYETMVRDGFVLPNGELINNEVEWRRIHELAADKQIVPIYFDSEKLRIAVFGERIAKAKKNALATVGESNHKSRARKWGK